MGKRIRVIQFKTEGEVEKIHDIFELEIDYIKTASGKFQSYAQKLFDEAIANLTSGETTRISIENVID